jgi:hypothetical protein
MKRFFSTLRFLLVAVAIVCVQCADMGGGGTIETTNGLVTGMVVLPGGGPAARTQVKLLPAGYDPVKDTAAVKADTTDAMGKYSFSHVYPGDFTIQAVQLDDRTRVLITGIHVANDTVAAPAGTLHAPGTIRVYLPGGINSATGYVYVAGTVCFVFLNNHTDFVILDSVPAGVIPAASYSAISITSSSVIRYDVPIVPGDTTVIYNPSWKYARRLAFNTSSSGAAVTGNTMNFPVLIRFKPGDFDFSQAEAGGTDIRFAKSDNTFLPYEIERWDAVNRQAEIWVRVDTVYGSDSAQFIVMYWGNPQAGDNSNGAAVFNTSNGFIGVWHMSEDPSAGTGSIKDRTANAHNATPYGSMTAANSVDGAVGKALSFDGKDDYLNAGNVSVPGNYSVGLWVLLDTLGDYQRFIIKDSSYTLWYDKDSVSVRMEHMPAGSWWRGLLQDGGTRVPMTTGAWYYFVGTFDGAAVRLYANGAEASVSGPISAIPRTNSKPVTLGQATGHSFVNGIMDEIRIEGTARSADWIRLCYMNQRMDDKLIVFK